MPKSDSVKQPANTTGKQRDAILAFIQAGIEAINESGVDHISVSRVTALAKSSRPTFYAYFGDIAGLLADTWLHFGAEFLAKLADPDYRLEVQTSQEQAKMRALLEVFTVSHRIQEVHEVLAPNINKWWHEAVKPKSFVELKLSWLTANRLGSWLTQPIEPKAIMSGIVEQVLTMLGPESSGIPADPRFIKLPEIKDPGGKDLSMTGQLLDAAIRVIAKSGVVSATMVRIGRNAQVSTGTIYPRFANGEDILLETFDYAISQVVDENFSYTDQTGFAPDQFGAVVIAGLGKSRQIWRDFRIETHLEGRVNPALSQRMRQALEETNKRVMAGLGALPVSAGEREAIAFLVHTIGIGMALLQNAGVNVANIDHRLITREMIAAMARRP